MHTPEKLFHRHRDLTYREFMTFAWYYTCRNGFAKETVVHIADGCSQRYSTYSVNNLRRLGAWLTFPSSDKCLSSAGCLEKKLKQLSHFNAVQVLVGDFVEQCEFNFVHNGLSGISNMNSRSDPHLFASLNIAPKYLLT